jgi:hypothetical protein
MHNMRIPYSMMMSERPHGRPLREPEHVIFRREVEELKAQRRRARRAKLIRRIRGG